MFFIYYYCCWAATPNYPMYTSLISITNRVGLDELTSISSRTFELYVQQNTPVEVAIALNLEAEKAINYYHQYFMLLGITEFKDLHPDQG